MPDSLLSAGVPVLGICYGQQVMAAQLGGKVAAGHKREFGRAEVEVLQPSALFEGVWEKGRTYPVWMSHGDAVTELPSGFSRIAASGKRADGGDRRPIRAASMACNFISKWRIRLTAPG